MDGWMDEGMNILLINRHDDPYVRVFMFLILFSSCMTFCIRRSLTVFSSADTTGNRSADLFQISASLFISAGNYELFFQKDNIAHLVLRVTGSPPPPPPKDPFNRLSITTWLNACSFLPQAVTLLKYGSPLSTCTTINLRRSSLGSSSNLYTSRWVAIPINIGQFQKISVPYHGWHRNFTPPPPLPSEIPKCSTPPCFRNSISVNPPSPSEIVLFFKHPFGIPCLTV